MDKDGNEFSSEWLEGSDGGALEDTRRRKKDLWVLYVA